MKNAALLLNTLFLLTLAGTAAAQTLQQHVTLQYSNKRLEYVLTDISENLFRLTIK